MAQVTEISAELGIVGSLKLAKQAGLLVDTDLVDVDTAETQMASRANLSHIAQRNIYRHCQGVVAKAEKLVTGAASTGNIQATINLFPDAKDSSGLYINA